MLSSLVLVSALAAAANARFATHACMTPDLQADFNIDRYWGEWTEQYRDLSIPFESGECVTAVYSATGDNDWPVKVVNAQGFFEDKNHMEAVWGAAKVEGPATLGVAFTKFQPPGDYRVVSTDYESYVVIYSCTPIVPFGLLPYPVYELTWVLTRDRTPSEETLTAIANVYAEHLPLYKFPADLHKTMQDIEKCDSIAADVVVTSKFEPYL